MLADERSTTMLELFQESLLPVNLPFTILLGAVAAYWVIGLLGVVDLDGGGDAGDIDGFEVGGDGGDGGHVSGGGAFQALLKVVGASDAPLIFVVSLFSIFLWATNVLANHYFNPGFDMARSTILLIPVVIGSFVVTRLLVVPLRPFMKMIRTSEATIPILGASGRVRSSQVDENFGEVEVETSERNLILRARVSANEETLKKGDPVLVVSKDEDTEIYVVRALNS